jgi:hypothetical protein
VNLRTIVSRTHSVRKALLVVLAAAAAGALIAACGGGDDDGGSAGGPSGGDATVIHTPIDAAILPTVISSDLAIGDNRFLVGLRDQDSGDLVLNADLHLSFYRMDTDEGTLKFEADAEPIVITRSYTHTHPDGTIETHEAGTVGAYVTRADFDAAGLWGVEVTGTTEDGRELEPVRPTFNVLEESFGLAVGDPAPRSVQTILADVDDIREIDTSQEPVPEQHNMTVADAVASGRPTVLAIATPAFCASQICGPTKDFFDQLYEAHKDEANFVHVEPYDVARVNAGECDTLYACANPIVDEWGLQSEPWVFIIDAQGNIAAKFEGLVTFEEMEAALAEVLG